MKDLLNNIIDIVKEAGKIIRNADRDDVNINDKPGRNNFVTSYDVKVQSYLTEKLSALLPEAEFLCEEGENESIFDSEYIFVIDPIDGTTNFIKDYHISCISVGLIKDNERYLGVVYNPYLDEIYSAEKGKGAFLNGKPIKVSDCNLCDGLVMFGTSPYYEELKEKSFQLAKMYYEKALDIRRSGSAALDLCTIAAGRAELYFELKISPWDFCAGALILEEAGGVIVNDKKENIPLFSQSSVFASNKSENILFS